MLTYNKSVDECPFCSHTPYRFGSECISCQTTSGAQHIPLNFLGFLAEEFEELEILQKESTTLGVSESELKRIMKTDYVSPPNPQKYHRSYEP